MSTETYIAPAAQQYAADIPLELAVRAHERTSHTPEYRGAAERKHYAEALALDCQQLQEFVEAQGVAVARMNLPELFANYREGMRRRYVAYLGAHSRCISSMIVGPSRFPVARAQKASQRADKLRADYFEYRERELKRIRAVIAPGTGSAVIPAGAADAVERLEERAEANAASVERMKEINKVFREAKKTGGYVYGIRRAVEIATLAERREILTYSRTTSRPEPPPFPQFAITNARARAVRDAARAEHVAAQKSQAGAVFHGVGINVQDCPAENRVRVFFPGKPEAATRLQLKRSGFRWTPSLECWQAFRSELALCRAKEIAGVQQ